MRTQTALLAQKQKQFRYYNHKARTFKTGDVVRMQCPGSTFWAPGKCVRKVAPRSFDIDVGGTTYRRNQRHMRLSSKDNLASSYDMADGSRLLEETTVLDTVSGAKPIPSKDEVRDEEPMLPRRSSRI